MIHVQWNAKNMDAPKPAKASSSRNDNIEDLYYHTIFEGLLFSAALFLLQSLDQEADFRFENAKLVCSSQKMFMILTVTTRNAQIYC